MKRVLLFLATNLAIVAVLSAISKWSAKRMTGAVPIETPATPIVMWFSRQRDFRADAGGARLTHPPLDERIAALRRAAN